VGDKDGVLSVWDAKTWSHLFTFELNVGRIRALKHVEKDGLLLVGKYNGEITVYETEFYNELLTFQAHKTGVSSLSFNSTENILVSGGQDAHIKSWDLNGNMDNSIPAHRYVIYGLKMFNASLSLSCSRDGSIKVWKNSFNEVVQKIDKSGFGHQHSVNQLIIIDEKRFASCSDDHTIKIFRRTGLNL
jgi:WD40 repeat protein